MARGKSTALRRALSTLCPKARIKRLARAEGLVRRRRRLDPAAFFWVLVLAANTGATRSLAELRRTCEKVTGDRFAPSSFYERFSPVLARFLKQVLSMALERLSESRRRAWTFPGNIGEGGTGSHG